MAPVATAEPTPPKIEESKPRARFEVSAGYPATLLYAIDGAAGERNHDRGYRDWLIGRDDAEPDWLAAWRERRPKWSRFVDDPDGGRQPFRVCSYDAVSLENLLGCLGRILDADDLRVAERALREADGLLKPRWESLAARLKTNVDGLKTALTSPKADELLALLRRAMSLPDDYALEFHVVLVLKPDGNHSYAQQESHYLVHEFGPNDSVAELLPTAFHEISHLAANHSPLREAMETEFLEHGAAGLVAAGLWDESFATAFGQGLAATEFDPSQNPSDALYDDPSISAVARALHARWKAGARPELGPNLAKTLVELVREEWPEKRWRVRDFFFRTSAHGDDSPAISEFRNAARVRSMSRSVPLGDSIERDPKEPPAAARLVAITLPTARSRGDVLKSFSTSSKEVEKAARRTGAIVSWTTDASGVPLVLLVAKDVATLRQAARTLGSLATLPAPGVQPLAVEGAGSR